MLFIIVIISLFGFLLVNGEDPLAQAKCRSEHHTDVDKAGTAYFNYKCKLICSIHNKLWPHNYSEGLPCPELAGTSKNNMVCKSGECISLAKLGFIDVEITSAEVPHKSNAYANVCIQNSSSPVSLPLRDRTSCNCETNVIDSNAHPVWQKICSGSNQNKWLESSIVNIEVWDKISSSITNFVGGASITITQLIANGNNHKETKLVLSSAQNGAVYVRITWTPA